MAINYNIKDTRLDKITTRKFDIKTKTTVFGKDLALNSIGSLDRIIGLDKMKQQTEKAILLQKGTYTTATSLGTALLSVGTKDKIFLASDIKKSLSEYAAIQQQQAKSINTNLLGINIYKTVDIKDETSWLKINTNVIPTNTYEDTDVLPNVLYYYAITTVYRDTTNRIKETQISTYKDTIITPYNELAASIDSDFIIINGTASNILYWNLPVELTPEEQLRSILSIKTTDAGADPREVSVSVKLTNREVTQVQVII